MEFKYFGTDGIRGIVNGPIMNPDFLKKFGTALGRYLRIRHPNGEIHLVIGHDSRESGKAFEKIIIDAVTPYGISIDLLGLLPTPAIAYWVDEMEADNGLVLTASHNPANYNGIKLFNAHGIKQTADKEMMIEPLIDEDVPEVPSYKKGEILIHDDALSGYVDHICEVLPKGSLKDWKIVLDCANGATFQTSPFAFEFFGADLVLQGVTPNGKNINDGVGSEHPEALAKAVKESGAKIGIAHDGDGDRMIMCDENGQIVDGDQILGILALHKLNKGLLINKILVATIQSNKGLDIAIEKAGGTVERSDIGDRNVFTKMIEVNAALGGEPSGHIIFGDYNKTGDGLLSALKVIEVMIETGERLADLRKAIPLFPQKTLNLNIKEKKPFKDLENTNKAIQSLEDSLGAKGRVLVRFSGTEPKIRLLVECEDETLIDQNMQTLVDAVKKDLTILD